LAEWRRLLRSSTTQARTVLQRILQGRIVFTLRRNPFSNEIDGYDFEAPTRFDKLFTGIAVERPKSLDLTDLSGAEDIGPDDTFDADYGRVLERAYAKNVKVLASPRRPDSLPPEKTESNGPRSSGGLRLRAGCKFPDLSDLVNPYPSNDFGRSRTRGQPQTIFLRCEDHVTETFGEANGIGICPERSTEDAVDYALEGVQHVKPEILMAGARSGVGAKVVRMGSGFQHLTIKDNLRSR
jgi:hypothetical protein